MKLGKIEVTTTMDMVINEKGGSENKQICRITS